MRYPVNLEPNESGSYGVTFPDVPEAITFGENREHALAMAADALESALDFYFEDRRPVPTPSPAGGRPTVALPASVAAKALLFNEMLAQGVKPVELARRLNVPRQEITRLLNPRHATKIDAIDSALKAMGRNLELHVQGGNPVNVRSSGENERVVFRAVGADLKLNSQRVPAIVPSNTGRKFRDEE